LKSSGARRSATRSSACTGALQGSVEQQVHDGDTITVKAAGRKPKDEIGNVAVRFLGVDAPEVASRYLARYLARTGSSALLCTWLTHL
jgi:endonuclease YncB( thermonuclease family)